MMNKKILISVASIVAVLALLGGGTFAAWSDFGTVTGNAAGAGALVLDLSNGRTGGLALPFNYGRMAPGEQNQSLIHLANANLDYDGAGGAPTANAYVTLQNLIGVEDGCLTSAAEDADQLANYADSCDVTNALFDAEGQFRNEAVIELTRHIGTIGATCPPVNGDTFSVLPGSPLVLGTLQEVEDGGRILIGELRNGESACLNVNIKMPAAAGFNNSAQGDSAAFDLRFDLEQT